MSDEKTSIQIQPDCGNAPRKIFLKDLNIAIAKGDLEYLDKNIPVVIRWEIVGQKNISTKEKYLDVIKNSETWKVKQLDIDTIITHGPDASVSGKIITKHNLKFSFCNIYRFKGAGGTTIHSITTFIIAQ